MMVLGIHFPENTMTYWATCGWFMVGVLGHQTWKLLGYFTTPAASRDLTMGQCLAAKGQGLVAGFFLSALWVGGHLWTFLESLEAQVPALKNIPVVDTDQLGSALVGFALSWMLIPWMVKKFGPKPKP